MITSWYWHLLLLWVGGMVVSGKAMAAPRDGPGVESSINVNFLPVSLELGVQSNISFTTVGFGELENLSLILLQYEGEDAATQTINLTKVTDIETGFKIQWVQQRRSILPLESRQTTSSISPPQNVSVWLVGTNNTTPAPSALQNLLFCIGPLTSDDSHNICNYYSETFTLAPNSNASQITTSGEAVASATTEASLSTVTPPLLTSLLRSSFTVTTTASAPLVTTFTYTPTIISTSIAGTVTTSPAPTIEPSSTAVPTSSSKHTSGLSTGAKIGIAIGSLALLCLILLLALFFLRKKHSKRALHNSTSQPEQVLLTRDMHTDSFTRNQLILEKERNGSSTIVPHDGIDTPMEGNSPTASVIAAAKQQQRHSALSPYEPLPSAPYNGSISPRRKPAPASPTHGTASNMTFPMPPTSTSPPPRTQSQTQSQSRPQTSNTNTNPNTNTSSPPHTFSSNTHTHSPSISDSPPTLALNFEAYHDIPLYGDARHVPQVFTNNISERERERGIESPFLREEMEGMTPEEIARLEEEERRIDAAIAAAEAGR